MTAKRYPSFIAGILVFFGLYLTSLYSYPLFHSLAEIFSIVIACGIFMIAWNSRRFLENNYLLFIGIAYLFIGGLDLVHTLAYKGMGVFKGPETNLPTQLWIAARYMESISLLLAPFFFKRKLKPNFVFLVYSMATFFLLASIFYWNIFPLCFVEGMGLTPFKKVSEYMISLILLASIFLLLKNQREFERDVFRWVAASIVLTIASELAFTFYVDAYGLSNLIGHFFKILSFYFLYKAIIETSLKRPYDLLFRNLKKGEEALRDALKESQQRQAEISALLEGARAVLEHHEFKVSARSIFDSCKNLIGAPAGYIALLSKDGTENELLFLDSGGLPCTVDPNLPMPIRGLREEAYRSGKTVFNNDFLKSSYMKYMPEGHARLDSVLFAPLVIKGKVIGLLGMANKPGGFKENDARMASAFGELAAIALHNSRTLEFLEVSEQRFRSVVQTASDAIISVDCRGNIVFWNNSAKTIFGYAFDKVTGKPLTIIMPDRFREAHQKAINRIASTGESTLIGKTVEMVGLRKDGAEFPLELSLATWGMGEDIFFTGIIRDITERKRMEEQLRKSRDELEIRVQERTAELSKVNQELLEQSKILESFFRNTITPLVFLDKNFNFIRVNEAYAKACQRDMGEFPGHNYFEFYPSDAKAIFEQVVQTKVPFQAIARPFTFPDHPEWGETYWDWTLTPVLDNKGEVEYLVFSLNNVTERKRAVKALRKSEKRLRTLSSQLLTAQENERKRIARELHDGLGQVLTAIKFKVENVLQQEAENRTVSKEESLETVISMIRESIEEVRRIQMDLRPSTLDDLGILATIGWFTREFQKVYSHIQIEKQLDLQEAEVPDPLKIILYRITQEALNNIAKHSQADRVRFSLKKKEDGIELVVEDNGFGFDMNHIKKGFGISSMRERTELSGGRFEIESTQEAGTTIRASWPIS